MGRKEENIEEIEESHPPGEMPWQFTVKLRIHNEELGIDCIGPLVPLAVRLGYKPWEHPPEWVAWRRKIFSEAVNARIEERLEQKRQALGD